MAWSVTVTKFDTGRTVLVVGVGGAGVGAWACPVNPGALSRAVVRRHSLIEHLIGSSRGRDGRCYSLGWAVTRRRYGVLGDLDAEDVTGVRTLHGLPSRMDPGIAADEVPVVPHQPVRVARSGRKIDRHQELAALSVVFVQAGVPLRVAGAVGAGHDPDIALVVEGHVVEPGPLLRTHADQDFGNPRRRIDPQDAAQA